MDEKLNNTHRSINPTNGDSVGETQLIGSSETDLVIENSNLAFYSWGKNAGSKRSKTLA